MNYYETLYIVHPALEAGRLKDIILSVESVYSTNKASVLSTHVWGKKKLAYLIEKQKYGTYVLVQFESDGQNISTISTELEINPNILAHLITKINDTDLQKESRSLDEQITGNKSSATRDTQPQKTEDKNQDNPNETNQDKNDSIPDDASDSDNKTSVVKDETESVEKNSLKEKTNEESEAENGINEQ